MDNDLLRRLWVTGSAAACAYGTLLGFGVIGIPVEDSAAGALSAEATVLAPAGAAFSIWSLIYLGLLGYVILQWLPRNAGNDRFRRTGWLAGVSMVLNAAWILVTQQGLVWLSVAVILALAVVLGLTVERLSGVQEYGLTERIFVDGTFGAYLGWVTIASCANVAAAGHASGWTTGSIGDQVLAVAVLMVAIVLGAVFAWHLGGRISVALALAWGLAWIGIARLTGSPESTIVGAAGLMAAAIVLATPILERSVPRARHGR